MIDVGTHLFGSKRGYSTLASSPALSREDVEELSVLSFGQTTDPAMLNGLAKTPCALGRPLRSGRYAITRCFAGQLDDAARPTLRLLTMVIEAADAPLALRGLKRIVADDRMWSSRAFAEGASSQVDVQPDETPVREADLRVFGCWLASQESTRPLVVLGDDEATRSLILDLPRVLSERDRIGYRFGIRLLSSGAPVDVCTMMAGASAAMTSRRRVVTMHVVSAGRLAAIWPDAMSAVGRSALPPVDSLLAPPEQAVANGSALVARGRGPSKTRNRWILPLACVLILLIGSVSIAAVVVIMSRPSPTEPTQEPAKGEDGNAGEPTMALPTERPGGSIPGRVNLSSLPVPHAVGGIR